MDEIALGQYGLPVLLAVICGLIYKITDKPDGGLDNRWKVIIPILGGIGLGILALLYRCQVPGSKIICNFVSIVDYCLYGFMTGASAIGLYELQKSTRGNGKPK